MEECRKAVVAVADDEVVADATVVAAAIESVAATAFAVEAAVAAGFVVTAALVSFDAARMTKRRSMAPRR